MYVCGDCESVWQIKLLKCGRCRSTNLHMIGDEETDFDLPIAKKYPLRRVINRRGVRHDTPTSEVDGHPAQPEQPAPQAGIERWKEYALALGCDPALVAVAEKEELRAATHRLQKEAAA